MQPKQAVIQIAMYKTNVGTFIKRINQTYGYETLKQLVINNIDFNNLPLYNGWNKIQGEVLSVKRKVPAKREHIGYELKDTRLLNDPVVPLRITDRTKWKWGDDEEGDGIFLQDEYKGLDSLYKEIYTETEATLEDVDFEVIPMGNVQVTDPENIANRKITVTINKEKAALDLSSVAEYDDITKILTPEFALHDAPCSISSKQMYNIVRSFVKENYDRKEARITSDYDFCFTVKKIVHTKPWNKTIFTTGKRNKMVEKQVVSTEKEVEFFQMTWDKAWQNKPYDKYTSISAIEADNLFDLKEKLDTYLNNLISVINAKVQECECCNGTGHLVETVSTNGGL